MDKENNFFSEYFEALIQNESFKQLFLMKHNHTLKISQEDIDKLDLGEYQFLVYYHKYSAQQVRKPYEPFLDIIKKCWEQYGKNEEDLDLLFEVADVYPMHQEMSEAIFDMAGLNINTIISKMKQHGFELIHNPDFDNIDDM